MNQAILETISASEPDWSRERLRTWWDPSRQLIKSIRKYQLAAAKNHLLARIQRRILALQHRFWSVITGAEIDIQARINGGLLIPHPNGIVIHPAVKIGPNCLIFQQVTIGTGGKTAGVPTIGGHVDIGAGAKVLGGITIGDHAKIGANAVVINDVPERATAVGVPARILIR
jgi:serine O-acetyltransferase